MPIVRFAELAEACRYENKPVICRGEITFSSADTKLWIDVVGIGFAAAYWARCRMRGAVDAEAPVVVTGVSWHAIGVRTKHVSAIVMNRHVIGNHHLCLRPCSITLRISGVPRVACGTSDCLRLLCDLVRVWIKVSFPCSFGSFHLRSSLKILVVIRSSIFTCYSHIKVGMPVFRTERYRLL